MVGKRTCRHFCFIFSSVECLHGHAVLQSIKISSTLPSNALSVYEKWLRLLLSLPRYKVVLVKRYMLFCSLKISNMFAWVWAVNAGQNEECFHLGCLVLRKTVTDRSAGDVAKRLARKDGVKPDKFPKLPVCFLLLFCIEAFASDRCSLPDTRYSS